MAFTRAIALAELDASLLDAAAVFGPTASDASRVAAMGRALDAATRDFDRVAPRVEHGQLQLLAGQRPYAAPADAIRFHSTPLIDDNAARDLTDPLRVDLVPTPTIQSMAGVKVWVFTPLPTVDLLMRLGSAYPLSWYASHRVTDSATEGEQTTIEEADKPLFLLRAQVEVMKELAIRSAHKPVELRDARFSQIRNGHPSVLYQTLMGMWEQQIRDVGFRYGDDRHG